MMLKNSRMIVCLMALPALGFPLGTARAGVVRDLAAVTNFDIRANRNPLSGGIDFLGGRTFIGNPLDFGLADLTLQGPFSLAVTTGQRGFSQFDIRLSTAANGDATAVPLTYLFNSGVGGQATQISGSLLLDVGLSINTFGFYDMELVYSSRQDVVNSGRLVNDAQAFDFDAGPINVSGNIYADLLAVLTEPIFEGAGVTNPFVSFSGVASLSSLLTGAAAQTLDRLASGEDVVEADGEALADFDASDGSSVAGEFGAKAFNSSALGKVALVVPEPTVLVLMLLGIPAVMGWRLRRRAS